jgi:exosortase C (VPDSG-CTERM-specific)
VKPLYDLARYAWNSDLYSHILLVPVITLYLIRLKRGALALDSKPMRWLAIFPLIAGAGTLASYWRNRGAGQPLLPEDYLSLMTFAFLAFLVSGAFVFLGIRTLRQITFPIAFLVFTVPFPTLVVRSIEEFLQYRSADVAYALFNLWGTPVLRQGPLFALPGFSLQVAPECSGIHSTLVLFITSLLAGYVLLRSPARRCVLALAVIPLALLRNGLRIFVIGELCVNVSPEMIDSYIHHKGGPIFFALSLVPFFLLLLILRKREVRSVKC